MALACEEMTGDLASVLRAINANRVMVSRSLPDADFAVFLDFEDTRELDAQDPDAALRELLQLRPDNGLSFSGWVGFFGYEFLAANMGFRCKAACDIALPSGLFARPGTVIQVRGDRLIIESNVVGRTRALVDAIATVTGGERPFWQPGRISRAGSCNFDPSSYSAVFKAAREEIIRGNTYQIKISMRYETVGEPDPIEAFLRLMWTNPAPEAFLLLWDDFSLVSCSPETVIHRSGNRIITRPIGGTVPRESSVSAGIEAITLSPKEAAEHNMIVDLERNDLSRVCETGTVRISELRKVETYAHLHHLVTTIEGELRCGISNADIIKAMLPGGSITGCPKRSTMELIDRFEPSFRGPYTGSFGVIHDSGDMRLNLIIRTLLCTGGRSYVQAGGGIVVDSSPEYEFNENRIKALALLNLLSS